MKTEELIVQVGAVLKPNSGISRKTHSWYVYFYVNGKQRSKSLSTRCVKEARSKRNAYFAKLIAAGATRRKGHGNSPQY